MAALGRSKDLRYLTEIPLTPKDFEAFERLRQSLENISQARLARILLHHAIWHPKDAVGDTLEAALRGEDAGAEAEDKPGVVE
jgi:hypothetical protein